MSGDSLYLSRAEAAERAGVGMRTLARAIASGALRVGRPNGPGGRVVIRVDWLDEWIAGRGREDGDATMPAPITPISRR